MPGHFINGTGNYIIVGTNQPYSGKVVNVGGKLFTTKGGTFEGNSQEVHSLNGHQTLPTVEDVVTNLNRTNNARTPNVNLNGNQMMMNGNGNGVNGNGVNRNGVNGNGMNNRMATNRNPVTSTGIAQAGQYQFLNGTPVPQGTQIHTHRDGTIMLGHDPNAMGEIIRPVLSNRGRNMVRRGNSTIGRQTRRTNTGVGNPIRPMRNQRVQSNMRRQRVTPNQTRMTRRRNTRTGY